MDSNTNMYLVCVVMTWIIYPLQLGIFFFLIVHCWNSWTQWPKTIILYFKTHTHTHHKAQKLNWKPCFWMVRWVVQWKETGYRKQCNELILKNKTGRSHRDHLGYRCQSTLEEIHYNLLKTSLLIVVYI